jgi:hypothetical protein
VNGNVTLAGTTVYVDVDGGSLTRSGEIWASGGTITIDNTDTLQVYTNQAAIAGDHKHTVLSASVALAGQWGNIVWTGVQNPVAGQPWTDAYLPDEFDLIGFVPNAG